MDNYFSFYGLPQKFAVNEDELRQLYLQKSKEYHPDFHANDPDKLAEAMEMTSINNRAYKALQSMTGRVKHILELHSMLEESGNQIPQEFLMEMMDINEQIMELQMDYDSSVKQSIEKEVGEKEGELLKALESAAQEHDQNEDDVAAQQTVLVRIKEIYLKQKYLLRIRESLGTFAAD